jgi:hypothetical protein
MYDRAIREKARMLYMQGHTKSEIQDILKIGSNVTVLKWSKEDKWEEERRKLNDEVLREKLSERLGDVFTDTRSTLDGLSTIKDTALEAIQKKFVKPTKFGEAADVYIGSAKMERQIKQELLQITFVMSVANIIQEEVDEPEVLDRIGRRLNLLVRSTTIERNALPAAEQATDDNLV